MKSGKAELGIASNLYQEVLIYCYKFGFLLKKRNKVNDDDDAGIRKQAITSAREVPRK